MPPVDLRHRARKFQAEYSMLLMFDKIVLDRQSFETLIGHPHPYYDVVAETMRILQSEGFVELADYTQILRKNDTLLTRMNENDLHSPDHWLNSFFESHLAWRKFANAVIPDSHFRGKEGASAEPGHLPIYTAGLHNLGGSSAMEFLSDQLSKDMYEWQLRNLIAPYIGYVNANLIISHELNVSFHDWADFAPFYRQKFLGVGHENIPNEQVQERSRQLFDVAFPEFRIQTPSQLVKLLEHKRIDDLRALVQAAVEGAESFDEAFARSVFTEVIDVERRLEKWRKIVGYLTLPIGFVPVVGNPAQLVAEEAVNAVMKNKMTKPYRWFYMLSDVSRDELPPLTDKWQDEAPELTD
jgi:hypothetical protein